MINKLRIRGKFSPCGSFIYANSFETRNGSHNLDAASADPDEPHVTGSLIWRLHTGKLEQREMNAMDDTDIEHAGKRVKPTPVITSKWFYRLISGYW